MSNYHYWNSFYPVILKYIITLSVISTYSESVINALEMIVCANIFYIQYYIVDAHPFSFPTLRIANLPFCFMYVNDLYCAIFDYCDILVFGTDLNSRIR